MKIADSLKLDGAMRFHLEDNRKHGAEYVSVLAWSIRENI
jgi:hypothetical protein